MIAFTIAVSLCFAFALVLVGYYASQAVALEGELDDTYSRLDEAECNLRMDLGNYGGDNESGETWPNGVADPEYDFWTPLIVIANSSHADQGDEALR